MTREVDPEVLAGFIEEARSYLPQILEGIEGYRADPTRTEVLEEAHRHAHSIKGASSMVGLSGLSHIADQLEQALEEVAAGQLGLSDEVATLFLRTLTQIESYLEGAQSGTLHEQPLLDEVARDYQRLRQPPAGPPPGAASELEPAGDSPAPEPPPGEEVSPELLEVFALETEDHLRTISTALPALERQPDDRELVQEVRRSAHTLKGVAAMVGFARITQLAHRMEDLLDLLYEGAMKVTPEILKLLFESTDALEDLTGGNANEVVLQGLYARYSRLLEEADPAEAPVPDSADVPTPVGQAGQVPELPIPAAPPAEKPSEPDAAAPGKTGQTLRVPLERLDELVKLVSELVITRHTFEQRMADYERQVQELQRSNDRLRRVASKLETQYEAQTLGGGRLAVTNPPHAAVNRLASAPFGNHGFDDLEFDRYTEFHLLSRELAETTTDVHTVGNDLAALSGDFESYLGRQARLSSEIQDKLMRVRMVPLATLASRLQRTVRSVADRQGKQVDLVLEGEATELDKTVLEEMADPLLHLLRNAVDHGIESPGARRLKGKPERGTIRLRAFQDGTQVVLQIGDDGAGVDPQAVRAAAVQNGFLPAGDAAELSDEELLNLVFLPGFSTANEVSEISGRGVGLDIVRAQVHKLKGTLLLESRPDQGATFTIRLPLTLAVTRALLVKAHGQTFALPLGAVTQILRLGREEVEQVGREPVVRIGGQVYPWLSLGQALNLAQPADDSVRRPPVLVLNLGDRHIAVAVDHIVGGREIVVKSLGTPVRRVRGVAGATLMGDGTVVLIVNPAELVIRGSRIEDRGSRDARPSILNPRSAALTVMVVDDSPSVRRVVTNLIKNANWTPVPAKDGLEALEILHHAPALPDLILLDIEMPRMDGFELLATLRGQEAYRQIPVVMVTSRAGEKHRRKALDLGATGYVVKPYQDEALLRLIRELATRQPKPSAGGPPQPATGPLAGCGR
jgi:chemosensory pili system protein ChpA (sensor histidine kinase/response regulator)